MKSSDYLRMNPTTVTYQVVNALLIDEIKMTVQKELKCL